MGTDAAESATAYGQCCVLLSTLSHVPLRYPSRRIATRSHALIAATSFVALIGGSFSTSASWSAYVPS